MLWVILALVAAFLNATYFTTIKKYLQNINQFVLSGGALLTASAILFIISSIKGFPKIGGAFYGAVMVIVALNFIAIILYMKALKITDLSLAIPMLSFTPLFLILTSFLQLHELPTPIGITGIILIVLGTYLLNTNKNNSSFLSPFKEMIKNKGILFMLVVAFIYSISTNFIKVAVLNSDPIFASFVIYLILGVVFMFITIVKKKNLIQEYKQHFPIFILIGFIIAGEDIITNIALTLQIVPYVISLKRLSLLFSVFYGVIVFKERNVLNRSLGAIITLSGVILIILF